MTDYFFISWQWCGLKKARKMNRAYSNRTFSSVDTWRRSWSNELVMYCWHCILNAFSAPYEILVKLSEYLSTVKVLPEFYYLKRITCSYCYFLFCILFRLLFWLFFYNFRSFGSCAFFTISLLIIKIKRPPRTTLNEIHI